jgi:YteA family regulatory protein
VDPQDREEIRARLLRERDNLQRQLEEFEKMADMALEDSLSELSTYDNHPADIGSETFERSKDLGLRDNVRLQMQAIDDALAKLDQGSYGYCDECGVPIDPERLRVLPFTTKCRVCQERSEGQVDRLRPIEEKTLARPFASPGHARTFYDREDTWQDVAQHGLAAELADVEEEDRGHTEEVDAIPVVKENGAFFQDTRVRGDTGGQR